MQLQRETEDGWQDMGQPRVKTKVPRVGKEEMTVVEYPGCVTGTWRNKVGVVMQEDADSDHFEIGESFSGPNHIECSEGD